MTDTTTGSAQAGTPAADAAAGNPTPSPAADAWTASFTNPDTKGFAELRGWKNAEQAVESFRSLEKLQGVPAERLLKLPETADDAAGWAEVHKRVGFAAPEKAEDYGLSSIEGINPDSVGPVQDILHKHGIPKDKAAAVFKDYIAAERAVLESVQASEQVERDTDLAKLKTEWGGNFDKLTELGKRAAGEYGPKAGLEPTDMDAIRDAIGQAKFNKLWAEIGSTTGEAKFHESDGASATPATMTPDAAKVRLAQLGQDKEWFDRYEKGGIRERQEYQRLRQIVANAAMAA